MAATDKRPVVPIRAVREAHGLTVRQLMDRIAEQGFKVADSATIRNVELGHKPGSKRLMAAWARALGLSPLDVTIPVPGDEAEVGLSAADAQALADALAGAARDQDGFGGNRRLAILLLPDPAEPVLGDAA